MLEVFKKVCYYYKGLVLVIGFIGFGKFIIMVVMIDYMNDIFFYYIIIIEDFVEFVYESWKFLIKYWEVGRYIFKFFNVFKGVFC